MTIDELFETHQNYLIRSEKAIQNHYVQYKSLRKLLQTVISHVVDIDEYERIAYEISCLICEMGQDTIFYQYFYENLNPQLYGRPRYFRLMCWDLLNQIHALNQWRKSRRQFMVIE